MPVKQESRIIVALDFPSRAPMDDLLAMLTPELCRVKVGKELFTRYGPAIVEDVARRGFDVFLDLKFHDIPNTVAAACRAAADLGVWMTNVHALGGRQMMEAARAAVNQSISPPLLIAVTILTSMDEPAIHAVGLQGKPLDNVLTLAALAEASGMDGVVCSPRECEVLRKTCGAAFRLVTPGVRPADAEAGDQSRVMTPTQAIMAGSDYLVIGRPITQAPDPVRKLLTIKSEIDAMLTG